jgi:hypothetical protein
MISTTIQTMRDALAIARGLTPNFPGKLDARIWELPVLWAEM